MTNKYLEDAAVMLRAARFQRGYGSDEAVVPVALLYAVGIEKVLKHILASINPLYVFSDPGFKHTASALYSSQMLSTSRSSKELAANPNHDLITLREALRRAALFSEVTESNFATLHLIATVRDVVAHCLFDTLPKHSAFRVAYIHGPELIEAYETELKLAPGALDGRNSEDPREMRERHQAEAALDAKIHEHRARWRVFQADSVHQEHALRKAAIIRSNPSEHVFFLEFPCPACSNKALLKAILHYDDRAPPSSPPMAFPALLECPYCDFAASGFHELDKLGTSAFLHRQAALPERGDAR